jgi:hypothetical protein
MLLKARNPLPPGSGFRQDLEFRAGRLTPNASSSAHTTTPAGGAISVHGHQETHVLYSNRTSCRAQDSFNHEFCNKAISGGGKLQIVRAIRFRFCRFTQGFASMVRKTLLYKRHPTMFLLTHMIEVSCNGTCCCMCRCGSVGFTGSEAIPF